jgi:hypothetical protein
MSPAFGTQRLFAGLLAGGILAAVAIAISAQGTGSTIYGCVSQNGLLTVVASPGSCKKAETPIEWNTAGPAGPQGPRGPVGPQGAPGEPAPALDLTVNCGTGGSIQGALDLTGDWAARVTITITGYCDEDVVLSRPNTTLQGVAPGDGFRSLVVDGAQRVSLNQLTLGGGLRATAGGALSANLLTVTGVPNIAVDVQTGATGTFFHLVINGCGLAGPVGCLNVASGASAVVHEGQILAGGGTGNIGVMAQGGTIILEDTTVSGFQTTGVSANTGGSVVMRGGAVRNNGDMGLGTSRGALFSLSNVIVEHNAWTGIAMTGGEMTLDSCTIRYNGTAGTPGGGIAGLSGAKLTLRDTTIADNAGTGVEMRDLSAIVMNRTTVTGNTGSGITLGSLSFLASSNASNTVSNNGRWGLTCVLSSRYRDYGAFSMSGNAFGDIAESCTPE